MVRVHKESSFLPFFYSQLLWMAIHTNCNSVNSEPTKCRISYSRSCLHCDNKQLRGENMKGAKFKHIQPAHHVCPVVAGGRIRDRDRILISLATSSAHNDDGNKGHPSCTVKWVDGDTATPFFGKVGR